MDKVTGKSLILDSEIQRLSSVTNQDISGKVDKVANKSLISNTEIDRLANVTNQTVEGLGAESILNKETVISPESNIKYPTSKAVAQYVGANTPAFPNAEINIIQYNEYPYTLPPLISGENYLNVDARQNSPFVIILPLVIEGRLNETVFHFTTRSSLPSSLTIKTSTGFTLDNNSIYWMDGMELILKPNRLYTVVFEQAYSTAPGSYYS